MACLTKLYLQSGNGNLFSSRERWFGHINLQRAWAWRYFTGMKKLQILIAGLLLLSQSFAQADLQKLMQEYVSRKPFLDTMHAYPSVAFDSLKVTSKEGIAISFWWMPHEKKQGTVLL